jgi:preprotein translocase subunit SecE
MTRRKKAGLGGIRPTAPTCELTGSQVSSRPTWVRLDVSETTIDEVGGAKTAARRNPFARLALFFRQVMAELRKVVRPTRQELITYTAVCLFFVVVVMAFVATLDVALGAVVVRVFGGSSA